MEPRQRVPLTKLVAPFIVAATGVGVGDYLITHGSSVYSAAVLGIGCGIIVVLAIGGEERRQRPK